MDRPETPRPGRRARRAAGGDPPEFAAARGFEEASERSGFAGAFPPRSDFEADPLDDPEGFARPRSAPGPTPRALPDLSLLLVLLDAVRAAVPRELQQQFTALLREVLLAVRALIDRYLDRLDGRSSPSRVEDIPID